MSGGRPGPLSRPFPLHRVTTVGVETELSATEGERAALAAALGLAAIDRLEARFKLAGDAERVEVTGRVAATISQTCVVTLDPFPAEIDEAVALTFVTPDPGRAAAGDVNEVELSVENDEPEELTEDRIDLGAIAAEFLALALDPYPRKPGVAFETPPETAGSSPFERLAALRTTGEG